MHTDDSSIPDHPAALRNLDPIVNALRQRFDTASHVLEIASGNGTHAQRCAREFPNLTWQPSEADPQKLALLDTRVATAGLANLLAPIALDVLDHNWSVHQVDRVLAINLIHIAPIEALHRVIQGASQCLSANGLLILYGPYTLDGQHTSAGNLSFDADLRSRNPRWGIRDLAQVIDAGEANGLIFEQRIQMPANNQLLILSKP